MTNLDQAAQVIYDEANQTWERGEILTAAGEAERLANALAKAGLLAPDLPEPSRGMGTSGAVWYLPYHIGDIRRTGEHIVAFGHDCQDKPFRLVLTETETETIARTLLAAAQHAKEEA